jgi:hypothetical protein
MSRSGLSVSGGPSRRRPPAGRGARVPGGSLLPFCYPGHRRPPGLRSWEGRDRCSPGAPVGLLGPGVALHERLERVGPGGVAARLGGHARAWLRIPAPSRKIAISHTLRFYGLPESACLAHFTHLSSTIANDTHVARWTGSRRVAARPVTHFHPGGADGRSGVRDTSGRRVLSLPRWPKSRTTARRGLTLETRYVRELTYSWMGGNQWQR